MPNKRKKLDFKERDLWYLVGLIATDGNLSQDGRHINITSKHKDFLETVKNNLGLKNRIGTKHSGSSTKQYYQVQIANVGLYEFLLSIGLTPKKSLMLGELKVPSEWFADFLRGVIDGDGSIRTWVHPSNGAEQWSLRIYSAAAEFIHWLEDMIERNFWVTGRISKDRNVFVMKFGKLAAKRIFENCYYEGCLGLQRKIDLAKSCCISSVGWSKSETVYCLV